MTTATTRHTLDSAAPGAVSGTPRLLLRLEGGVLLAAAILAFAWLGGGWLRFALFLLVPDLTMLGYLAGPRAGATTYNLGHTTLAPALLAGFGLAAGSGGATAAALIWLAHIGLDRLFGYGLKYAGGFGETHLGRVGRGSR